MLGHQVPLDGLLGMLTDLVDVFEVLLSRIKLTLIGCLSPQLLERVNEGAYFLDKLLLGLALVHVHLYGNL